jgi:hypothetical protein
VNVPQREQRVLVRLPNAHDLATHVREASGAVVWLDLPAVVRPGAPLALRWTTGSTVADAAGVVRASSRPGLAVGVKSVTETERRRLARIVPSSALHGTLASLAGRGHAACEVVDLSLGGVALRLPTKDLAGLGARLALRIDEAGTGSERPLELDVRSCRRVDGHAVLGCAFVSPALAALVVSHLIRGALGAA